MPFQIQTGDYIVITFREHARPSEHQRSLQGYLLWTDDEGTVAVRDRDQQVDFIVPGTSISFIIRG